MLHYLSEDGVKCTVITVDPNVASYPILDESLNDEVSSKIRVIRTHTREPLNAYKKITGSKETPYAGFANESSPSMTKRFSRWIRANFFIPDARKGWNKFAYRKAAELLKSEHFDAVITTSPPHSTQLIGRKLKQEFSIHWIADLRDPWTDIYYADLFPQTKWAKRKDLRLERSVLENADDLIVVSESIKKLFLKKGDVSPSKVHVIPNGFDEKDFDQDVISDAVSPAEFRIAYTGTLSEQYPIEAFAGALNQVNSDEIVLHFVGKINEKATELLEPYSLQLKGYVPHHESISTLLQADALLLIIPDIENNEGILTGKLFEYLGSRKPIILIGPPNGDAATIVNACQSGHCFGYDDIHGIQSYLETLMDQKRTGKSMSTPNNERVIGFSRKKLAFQVKTIIDNSTS